MRSAVFGGRMVRVLVFALALMIAAFVVIYLTAA